MNDTFHIEDAAREGAKMVIGLAGTSGSGKTYSAIKLGYGLAKRDSRKLGFLDTENRRGRLYADILPTPFRIADFNPPFSPARYIDAINTFAAAGVDVLIIDSVTHEWEGTGGCEEIATAGNPRIGRWNKAKEEHKKFMNVLLQSPMHIICCIRAREKTKIQEVNGKTQFTPLGVLPICEKNFMFELTASAMMQDMGTRQDVLKCPDALKGFIGRGNNYLSVEDGENLRAWIDGATPIDRELMQWRSRLNAASADGVNALKAAFEAAPIHIRKALDGEKNALKAQAIAYDEQRKIAASEPTATTLSETANA